MESPRLTLRQLRVFLAVADSGTTLAGGEVLALSQSATSAALKELEALLGTPLFDRVGKRLHLNDSGRALRPQVRSLLESALEIERQFCAAGPAGEGAGPAEVRLGASTTVGNYLVPQLLAAFAQVQPRATVEVRIGNTQEIAAAVARLEVDLGLIEGPCREPELQVLPWREDRLVVACAPSHPLSTPGEGRRHSLRALRRARWLLREPGSGTREAVEQALLPHLHHFDATLQLGSSEAIRQAAAAGLGVACLSLEAVRDLLALGRLVEVDSTLPPLRRQLSLVHHRGKRFSPALLALIRCCGEGLAQRLEQHRA